MISCRHCKTRFWIHEPNGGSKPLPPFSIYCPQGRVQVPEIATGPGHLKFISDQSAAGNTFSRPHSTKQLFSILHIHGGLIPILIWQMHEMVCAAALCVRYVHTACTYGIQRVFVHERGPVHRFISSTQTTKMPATYLFFPMFSKAFGLSRILKSRRRQREISKDAENGSTAFRPLLMRVLSLWQEMAKLPRPGILLCKARIGTWRAPPKLILCRIHCNTFFFFLQRQSEIQCKSLQDIGLNPEHVF